MEPQAVEVGFIPEDGGFRKLDHVRMPGWVHFPEEVGGGLRLTGSLRQMRQQEPGAEGVSGGAGVQFVIDVEFGFGHAIRSDRVGPEVYIREAFSGGDVFAHQFVGLLLFVALLPSLGTGVETEKDDFYVLQGGPDFGYVGFEIRQHLFRRFPGIDVIAAGLNDDGLWLVVD